MQIESLTPKEVADTLKLNPSTIYGLIQNGTIRSFRIGRTIRVRREDLETLMTPKMSREEVLAG
jgi:excisionase family DNA binding protein